MINKNNLIKKLKKNRLIVIIISVIVIVGVYYGVEKAIDSYNFINNRDILEIVESESKEDSAGDGKVKKNWFERLFGGEENLAEESGVDEMPEDGNAGGKNSEVVEKGTTNTTGKVAEEEVNLELGEEITDLEDSMEKDVEQAQEERFSEEKIYVYITGEINVPGVVILNKGSRIVDAINGAGGITAKADVSKVNLVYVLEDGMKVNIPNSNDLKNNPNFEYITMSSGDGANDVWVEEKQNGDYGHSSSSSVRNYSVVNINKATQTELESLPGIGPSLALKIINYRKENGNFSSIEDIKNVSGIGESKFESLKKYIVV